MNIHQFAIHWCLVHLEVPRMYYSAYWCFQENRTRIWNGVVRLDKAHFETSHFKFVTSFDNLQFFSFYVMFF